MMMKSIWSTLAFIALTTGSATAFADDAPSKADRIAANRAQIQTLRNDNRALSAEIRAESRTTTPSLPLASAVVPLSLGLSALVIRRLLRK